MTWFHTTITTQVKVPALFSGDDTDVFALGFCTLTGTTGYCQFHFVWRTNTAIALFQHNGHAYAVLHTITAPGGADAAFNGTHGFAIGVSAFETGVDQLFPDQWQLMGLRAEQVDSLAAGDLGVQIILFTDLADGDQSVGGDFTAGYTRHDRISAVLLHVRHEVIVGVLQSGQRRFDNVVVPAGSQDGSRSGLTDITAFTFTMFGNQFFERANAVHAHQVIQFLP